MNSPNYNADVLARSSGKKTAAPIIVDMFKTRAKFKSEGVQKQFQQRHCEANRGKTKDNSKNVRTPDNNEAAHVAADEDPPENGVRNMIATRERSDPKQ